MNDRMEGQKAHFRKYKDKLDSVTPLNPQLRIRHYQALLEAEKIKA